MTFFSFPFPPLQYVRQGDCFMLVYSITSRSSFDEAQAMYNWITRIRDQEMPVVRQQITILVLCMVLAEQGLF